MNLEYDEGRHLYSVGGELIPSVTQILNPGGIPANARDAADRGSAVHYAIHLHHKGTLDPATIHPEAAPYFISYERFLEDCKPEVVMSEEKVWHDQLYYAGTVDLVVQLFGKVMVLDVKTGSAPAYSDMQVEAYARALERCAALKITSRRVLVLKESHYMLRDAGGPMAWAQFRQKFIEWKREHESSWRARNGEPRGRVEHKEILDEEDCRACEEGPRVARTCPPGLGVCGEGQ